MVLCDNDQKVLNDFKRKRIVVKASIPRVQKLVMIFNPREKPITLLECRQDQPKI